METCKQIFSKRWGQMFSRACHAAYNESVVFACLCPIRW